MSHRSFLGGPVVRYWTRENVEAEYKQEEEEEEEEEEKHIINRKSLARTRFVCACFKK